MERGGSFLRIGVIGVNYKTADLGVREKIARCVQKMDGERGVFFKHPIILLSTCNRSEVYFSAEDLAEAHSHLLSFLRAQIESAFSYRLYSYFGGDCFLHLCRVAAGLDSAILAETEIQRQVKMAYTLSASARALPGCLHYVFQKALRIGKLARARLSLEGGGGTLYGTLWQLAEHHFSNLAEKRILLVGYSEVNRGFMRFLWNKSASRVFLATRFPHFVKEEGIRFLSRDLLERWSDFDWIICAAKSENFLISGMGFGSHLIFDLSVPRNVDPCVQGAVLMNIEQINRVVEQNRKTALHSLEPCESFVHESVCRLASLYSQKAARAELYVVRGSSMECGMT